MSGPSPELTPRLPNTMVRAGAGAGKTHGLIEQVVLVFEEFRQKAERPPRIVLTTFTRKATQELKERLILRACEAGDARLLSFVSDPSHLQISTMHGVMSSFLRRMGHLAGLDSGFQIVSEGEARQLARVALRETLLEMPDSLRWLESYKLDRLMRMLRGYDLAARENSRLRPAGFEDLESAAQSEGELWRIEIERWASWVESFTDDGKWMAFARELRAFPQTWKRGLPSAEGLPKKPNRSAKTPEFEDLHAQLERPLRRFKDEMDKALWNTDLWLEMTEDWRAFESVGQAFHQRLLKTKQQQARFEMADLELKTLEILREQPVLGEVFGAEWDYWMVDEYQDTSPMQVEILNHLMGSKPRYIVGDPQQSIYLFRGAEVGVFDRTQSWIADGGGEIRELRRNYRSVPELLAWINDFVGTLAGEFHPMDPRHEPRGEAKFQDLPRVHLHRAASSEHEVRAVVSQVGELLARGARLEQICILGRTRRGLMEVSRILRQFGYPTHLHVASGFTSRREVQDAQALWRFLVNPHDNLNLMTLLRSPWFLVEDSELAAWMQDRPRSLWRRLLHMEDHPVARRLRAIQTSVDTAGLAGAFEAALVEQGPLDLSLHNDPAGRKESNLWKMIHRARELEREGGASIVSLLEVALTDELETNEGDATSAQEPNALTLMTIHGSKGLQFDHIVMCGMGEAMMASSTAPLSSMRTPEGESIWFFPVWRDELGEFVSSPLNSVLLRDLRRRESEEFDRWLYVALTRARETITLIWSEVETGSWADRSSWFQRPPGEQLVHGCSVRMSLEMSEPYAFQGGANVERTVRPQFRVTSGAEDAAVDERKSVTALIQGMGDASPVVTGADSRSVTTEELMRRWQARAFGSSLHRALEALKYGRPMPLDPGQEEAVRFVLEIQEPPLREWIRQGETEWGFQVLTKRGLIEGQIDLWVKAEGRLYVVDYKSGSPAYEEDAFRQLSLYAWALRRFGHTEPAELLVIYPRLKKISRREFRPELLPDL